jgi:hypothetical protein
MFDFACDPSVNGSLFPFNKLKCLLIESTPCAVTYLCVCIIRLTQLKKIHHPVQGYMFRLKEVSGNLVTECTPGLIEVQIIEIEVRL